MTYLPHTEADRAAMLAAIGVKSMEALFEAIPEEARFPELELPDALSEMEALAELQGLSNANVDADYFAFFLGAGTYNHYVPSVINHILLRSEFYTAYTPYQPEVSQGTLQSIFEYQTMIAALTGMEVSNASHYDGATSLAEAVIMALNTVKGKDRKKVILSPAVHPQYRAVVRTYTQGMDLEIVGDAPDTNTIDDLADLLDDRTALLVVQTPNFFGQVEDLDGLAERVHAAGALLCVVADPIALGLFKPPGVYGADIVVGEGQPLGIPMSFGGPYLGFFATRKEYVRRMAGRLAGETVDADGRRGFVLTLSTREQHIRRERATSNICTNQGLMMLAATVYLSLLGKQGLRKVAELCYHKSHYAAKKIDQLKGFSVDMRRPFLKEFVVTCPKPVSEINNALMWDWDIVGGYDLAHDYPARANQMLVCVTEANTVEQIDALAEALVEVTS
ncbi:MAG: aminomethyl-transferring glycine dehydrogenase subunit GcvPA [Anaerolineae bacterium]|nr:aminomethyl-transferring glycine dehydrogenase subunit GcvPA [Anaerolineae bacterium]